MATQNQLAAMRAVIGDMNVDATQMPTGEAIWAFSAFNLGKDGQNPDLAGQDMSGAEFLMQLLGMTNGEYQQTLTNGRDNVQQQINDQLTAINEEMDAAIARGAAPEVIAKYEEAKKTLEEAQKALDGEAKQKEDAAKKAYDAALEQVNTDFPEDSKDPKVLEQRQAKLDEAKKQYDEQMQAVEAMRNPEKVRDEAIAKLNEQYPEDSEDKDVQEKRRNAMIGIERTYRDAMTKQMDELQAASQRVQLAGAQGDLATAMRDGKDTSRAESEVTLFKEVAVDAASPNGPKASRQINGGAEDYTKRVKEGVEARQSKRAENLGQFVDSIRDDINEYYEEKIKKVKGDNPLLADEDNDKVMDLKKEQKKLLAKLDDKSTGLAGQMEYAIKQIEKNDDLEEGQKRELRGKLMEFASQYEGRSDVMAQEFFRKEKPDMAPVDIAAIARANGVPPSEVFSISVSQKDGIKSLVIEGTGSGIDPSRRIEITDPAIVDKVVKNGMSVDGLQDSLFVKVSSGLELSEDRQLALHGTKGHDVKVWSNNGGRSSYSADDYKMLASTTQNVVSAGGGDQKFENSQTLRAYSLELTAMEKQAAEMERLAAKAEKVNKRMADAQRRIEAAGLPPEVLAAVRGEKQKSGVSGPAHVEDGTSVAANGRGTGPGTGERSVV